MKKRVNPLVEIQEPAHVLSKRINPLEISINENVSTREVKQKELSLTIDQVGQVRY